METIREILLETAQTEERRIMHMRNIIHPRAANNETYWQKKPEENHGFVSTGASKSLKEALNIYKKEKSWSAENDMIESLKTSKVWVPYISEKKPAGYSGKMEKEYYLLCLQVQQEMKEYGKKFYQREVYISDAD